MKRVDRHINGQGPAPSPPPAGDPSTWGREEKRAEFIRLRAKGYSYTQVAERLGVAKSTLANWNTELEAQVAQLKAMELEALYEEFFLLKEGRIRLLGEQLRSIREEIGRRGLQDVDTPRLHELLLRYFAILVEEFTEVRPLTDEEASALAA